MVLVAALAFRASRAETRKMGGARPRADGRPPATKERTCRDASSFCRRSALFTISTTFLPQSRISSRYPRSLSVRGRSAEVTKRTRSLRGTKPRLSSSWWRIMAFVPGVSTMAISRRNSLGYPFSRIPSLRSLSTGSSSYLNTVMRSVVGVTPSSEISASSNAFMNADLPELNSPTITSRKSSSRSACARRTRSTSSEGDPKSFKNPMKLSRSARSRSTRASRRSSRILIHQPPFSEHYSSAPLQTSCEPVSRPTPPILRSKLTGLWLLRLRETRQEILRIFGKRRFVVLAFTLLVLFWGSSFAVVKVGLGYSPPILFAGLRALIGGMAMVLAAVLWGGTLNLRRDWPVFLLLALFNVVLF